jgi:glucokinase
MDVLGIDLGGTQIRGAVVNEQSLSSLQADRIMASGSTEQILEQIFRLTDKLIGKTIQAIGIGVPSVVDIEKGVVYDVQNIPSWKEVPLKKHMEDRYHLPVIVNNDANCFALGEKYFGKGKSLDSFIALAVGTGIGAGVIIGGRLYAGPNCGAGEFGMVDYLDQCYEYYASGQFFQNCYQTTGEEVFRRAETGDAKAQAILLEMGEHLGNAIKMILYTYDPQTIILGGSISQAYRYYQETLWARIRTFGYPKSLEHFRIDISTLKNSGVLGAAALCYDHIR